MKNYLSSSERRGVIIVASVALLVTGIGAVFSHVNRTGEEFSMTEIEVMADGDSVPAQKKVNKKSERNKGKKNKSKAGGKKTYSERNPLDEPV